MMKELNCEKITASAYLHQRFHKLKEIGWEECTAYKIGYGFTELLL
jgi:hypothetical protein